MIHPVDAKSCRRPSSLVCRATGTGFAARPPPYGLPCIGRKTRLVGPVLSSALVGTHITSRCFVRRPHRHTDSRQAGCSSMWTEGDIPAPLPQISLGSVRRRAHRDLSCRLGVGEVEWSLKEHHSASLAVSETRVHHVVEHGSEGIVQPNEKELTEARALLCLSQQHVIARDGFLRDVELIVN